MWRDRTNLYLHLNHPSTLTIKLTMSPLVASFHIANPTHITLPPKSLELQEALQIMEPKQKSPEDSCLPVLLTIEML
jgi:hypothetical protein